MALVGSIAARGNDGPVTSTVFGNQGDVPITGDWDGSGSTKIGGYRPSTARFSLRLTAVGAVPPPPAPTTGQGTPVTTVLPAPSTRSQRRVSVRVVFSWTWDRGRTWLRRLRFKHLPRDATIALRCSGRGCSVDGRTVPAQRLLRLQRVVDGTVYHPRDRLTITIRAPGRLPERVVARVRYGRVPTARLL